MCAPPEPAQAPGDLLNGVNAGPGDGLSARGHAPGVAAAAAAEDGTARKRRQTVWGDGLREAALAIVGEPPAFRLAHTREVLSPLRIDAELKVVVRQLAPSRHDRVLQVHRW